MPIVMQRRTLSTFCGLLALFAAVPAAQAFGFGDMFSPGRWFGGNNDDYYYEDGPYGPYGPGPYGYGAPYAPYGAPGYAPYSGGYGYPAAPGYAPPAAGYAAPSYAAPAPAAPAAGADSAKDQEIEALKRRIEQLEGQRSAPPAPSAPPAASGDWPSAPAFRPMDQY
jgi:hypothetical protein